MIKFRHKTCTSHVISYVGQKSLLSNSRIKSADWRMPNGDGFKPYSKIYLDCPDCGVKLLFSKRSFSEINNDPFDLRSELQERDDGDLDAILEGNFEEYHQEKYGES